MLILESLKLCSDPPAKLPITQEKWGEMGKMGMNASERA